MLAISGDSIVFTLGTIWDNRTGELIVLIHFTFARCRKRPRDARHAALTRKQLSIRHFRNDKGTGAEMHPAIVSGIVTRDAPVSYWSVFSILLVTVPEAFAEKVTPPSFLVS